MRVGVAALKPHFARETTEMRTTTRWGWARHWELWLAVVVGAFLRLWHIDLSVFLADQGTLMQLTRAIVLGHLIPVTSVSYSVGGYAPPFGLFLVLPITGFTSNPLPVVISIALWNVVGVGLCYRFALAYYGRWVAGVGTLLFATCFTAVHYSRFIWQPNYEVPFVVLWAMALFAWCIGGRRGWFAVSAILLLLLIELTPVAVLLIPITAVAWLLAAARPGPREYGALALVALVVLSPTLLWEAITHGIDFQLLFHSGQPSSITATVFRVLYATIGADGSADLGPNSLYFHFTRLFEVVNLVAALFLLVGYVILTLRVAAPALRVWRAGTTDGTPTPGLWRRIRAWWAALRADRRWCVELLLWLWVTLPPLSMVRHSSPPTVHYLLLAYPALFLVAAYPLFWLVEADGFGQLARLARLPRRTLSANRAVSLLGVALVALLICGQALQSSLVGPSLLGPGFDALSRAGYPMSAVQSAGSQIGDLQRQRNASAVYYSLPAKDSFRTGMDYLLVNEQSGRFSSTDTCLVLPPPSATPNLVVTTSPSSPAAELLPRIANAQHVADVPILGGEPFHVYQISGSIQPLAGDTPIPSATYHPTPADALQLDDAALDTTTGTPLLRLRWTVLAAPHTPVTPEVYTIQAHAAGQVTSTPLGGVSCLPTRWQEGATVYTWIPLGVAGSVPPSLVSLTLGASAPSLYEPQVGPLHLLSGRVINKKPALVSPSGPPVGTGPSGASGVAPDGSYTLALAGLG